MRAEIRAADGRREVRVAAQAWRRAGAIEEATADQIYRRYADDRKSSPAGFRLLFFVFTLLGGFAVWGFVAALFGVRLFGSSEAYSHAVLCAVLGGCAALGTEVAIVRHRLRRFGVEEGLAWLALVFGTAAVAIALDQLRLPDRLAMGATAASFGGLSFVLAWRWAIPATGACAAVGLFGALHFVPGARLLWIAAGFVTAFATWRISNEMRIGPANRRRADEAFVVAIAALYLAVHVSGLHSDWFGWFARGAGVTLNVPPAQRALAWLAMTLLPLALVALGLRRRDRLPLALGVLLALATTASAVDALDLEPTWLVLLTGGLALVALPLSLRRLFASRLDRIANGFTDGPLFEPPGQRSFLEIAATLAAFTPEPRRPEDPSGFRGRGGDFGGGGASAEF